MTSLFRHTPGPGTVLRCALWAVAVASSLAALWPSAAVAAETATTLEVVSGEDSHTVEFTVCPSLEQIEEGEGVGATAGCAPEGEAGDKPYLGGETTLLLRLKTKVDPEVSVRFVPETADAQGLLCGKQDRMFLDGKAPAKGCSFAAVNREGEKVFPLRVGFRLPVGEPLSAIAGSLIVALNEKDEAGPIPLTGTLRELKGVEVLPSKLTLDSDNATAQVRLVGPGVVELLRSGFLGEASTLLRNDAGDTVRATVKFESPGDVQDGNTPDLATGELTLDDDDPEPGTYTGKLPASDAAPASTSIEIELKAHKGLPLMILLVLAGIVGIGLVTRLVTLTTRRHLLLEALQQSVDAFWFVAEHGKTMAWDLKDLLDVGQRAEADEGRDARLWNRYRDAIQGWRAARRSPYSGTHLRGLEALMQSIREARSSKDLDEDANRTLDMIARIQRWLRVEPVARRLAELGDTGTLSELSAGDKTLRWVDSQSCLETSALRAMAKREPADAAKADDLVGRLLFQIAFHHGFRVLWVKAEKDADLAKELIELDDRTKDEKTTAGARSAEQRDALSARLRSIQKRHEVKPGPAPKPMELAEWSEADDPSDLGLTPVEWEASPNLFTGWATLDGPSYGQLVSRTATSSRTVYRRGGFWEGLKLEARTLRPADLAWTAVILGLSSAAYGVTNYGHTWGSCEDMAKAFLAGAVGTATVKWGALPIFRSQRIRSTKEA